ncbi:MAG: SUF system Fe-S cluster assembly regulator [Pseudomonadota bacterium]|nr:SUF system Fe-S cluster assembly regulator [Pseudomonadota bacterium]
MLRIGKMTDYGVVVMTHLARRPAIIQTGPEIAAACRIALPTVSKLLKSLTRAGLLISVRGVCGGYHLARDPRQISVLDVIAALEGPLGLTECSRVPQSCPQEGDCSLSGHWDLISQAVRSALRGVSLAQMASPMQTVQWHQTQGLPVVASSP